MVSGSDAHEGLEIPMISAYESLLIPARALQVWAAVRKEDNSDRLHYSLAAGCLGRLVLSGNPDQLNEAQMSIVHQALQFYRKIVPVLQGGKVTIPHSVSGRWNDPEGFQVVRREMGDKELIVCHTFRNAPQEIELPGSGKVVASFLPDEAVCSTENKIRFSGLRDFTGGAVLIEKN